MPDGWLRGIDDESEAARLVAVLRAEGRLAVLRPASGAQLVPGIELPARSWSENGSPCASCGPSTTAGACRTWSNSTQTGASAAASTPRRGCCWRNSQRESPAGSESSTSGAGTASRAVRADGSGVDRRGRRHPGRAIEATRRNAALNGFERRVEATQAPLGQIEGVFDVVVANIGRAATVELAADLLEHLSPSGWLAVSGISPGQSTHVAALFSPLQVLECRTRDEWSAVVLARRSPGV